MRYMNALLTLIGLLLLMGADVAAYDEIHVQILGMADMLSLGIIHDFPKLFR